MQDLTSHVTRWLERVLCHRVGRGGGVIMTFVTFLNNIILRNIHLWSISFLQKIFGCIHMSVLELAYFESS